MSSFRPARGLVAALAATAALAQAPVPENKPSQEAGTPQAYRSVFGDYRPFTDEPVQSWRRSNDAVRDAGGWRAYAREAQGQGAMPGSPPSSAPVSGASRRH